MLRCHLFQSLADFNLFFGLVGRSAGEGTQAFSSTLTALEFGRRLELASTKNIPTIFTYQKWTIEIEGSMGYSRCKRHAKLTGHRDDITLEVAIKKVPTSLIDAKGSFPVVDSVGVSGGRNPGGGV